MKISLRILLTLLCLLSFQSVFAQRPGGPQDTIYYHGNENLNFYILSSDYHKLTKDDQLQNILLDFQNRLKEIRGKIPASSSYKIEYHYNNKIEILQSDRIASFTISKGKSLKQDFQNQALITDLGSRYHVNIGFNDLETLVNADFNQIIGEIIADLPVKDRYLRYLEYQPEATTNKAKLIQNRPSGYLDMLSLQAGVGANVYRSKFLTDITGELSLQLNQKGILRNQIYVSNNLMFSFKESNSALINNFTNIGYRINFSNQRDKPNWLGVEFGTLTKRSGDIFQPNTMRFGFNWKAAKHITVAPQMYFDGFFKNVSPGIRIGIGL
jgi:hypothetical protein